MKKIIVALLCIACLLGLTMTAFAANDLPSIVDEANLLIDSNELALSRQAASLKSHYGLDVVILTVNSTNGRSPRQYAQSYYDQKGYADDGILLLISMEDRDWYICTTGKAQEIFTDYGIEQLSDEFIDDLSNGDYFRSFSTFLDATPSYCEAYEQGDPIDERIGLSHVIIALIIGAAIGGITIAVMRSAMNTAKAKYSATEYVKKGSFRPYGNFDMYLYSHVTKTPRQNNSSGPRSGGGGGSRSHGGGGGKF